MSLDETDARLARLDWSPELRLALVKAVAETGVRVPDPDILRQLDGFAHDFQPLKTHRVIFAAQWKTATLALRGWTGARSCVWRWSRRWPKPASGCHRCA
jgi:hypothetical protein